MRKIFYVLLAVFLLGSALEAAAQMSRSKIKKNNRRLQTYRGKKYGFGKDKVYNTIGFSLNALNYYGDLAPRPNRISTDLSFTRPAVGLHYSHRFGPRYTLNGSIHFFQENHRNMVQRVFRLKNHSGQVFLRCLCRR